ncbi:MAG: hypothetical protein KBD78_05690 [Oligoflexales bacterium]|nr:hypothetical protein [Oligoflexales bacterium]
MDIGSTLLDVFRQHKIIDPSIESIMKNYMEKWGCSCTQAILEIHLMSETELANHLAQIFNVTRILDIREFPYDKNVIRLLPYSFAKQRECLAISRDEFDHAAVTVVMADPSDIDAIENVKKILGGKVFFAVTERMDLNEAIDSFYSLEDQLPILFAK